MEVIDRVVAWASNQPPVLLYSYLMPALFIYLLPTIVGLFRNKYHIYELAIYNVLAGWLIVTWFRALAFATIKGTKCRDGTRYPHDKFRGQGYGLCSGKDKIKPFNWLWP